jgi:hypothetical protein
MLLRTLSISERPTIWLAAPQDIAFLAGDDCREGPSSFAPLPKLTASCRAPAADQCADRLPKPQPARRFAALHTPDLPAIYVIHEFIYENSSRISGIGWLDRLVRWLSLIVNQTFLPNPKIKGWRPVFMPVFDVRECAAKPGGLTCYLADTLLTMQRGDSPLP